MYCFQYHEYSAENDNSLDSVKTVNIGIKGIYLRKFHKNSKKNMSYRISSFIHPTIYLLLGL